MKIEGGVKEVGNKKYTLTRGVTIWFTGLPSSGKSTVARILERNFRQWGLKVELLDGDVIRTNLSKGLGFSREDRDANIKRIGFVAHLLTRNDVIAIGAAISPFREARDYNRKLIGNFVEVYVKCSVDECEKRDVKGLFKKARAGEIKGFTGVDDPYEEPLHPELILDTEKQSAEESADIVVKKLEELGYIKEAKK